jgi:hypothetical protein
MVRQVKPLVFLSLSVLICLASEWGPKYIELFSRGHLKVTGRLSSLRVNCARVEAENFRCSDRYILPSSAFKMDKGRSFGLGIIVGIIDIYCTDSIPNPSPQLATAQLDSLNSYRVFRPADLACNQGSSITVDVWTPKLFRRHGYSGSPMIEGEEAFVEQTKRFVEFFTAILPILLTFLFLVIFVLDGLLTSFGATNSIRSPFERYGTYWAGFMLTTSGLVSTLLPIATSSLVFFRISNFFALCSHQGIGFHLLISTGKLPKPLLRIAGFFTKKVHSAHSAQWLTVISFFFCLSPFFAVGLGPIVAVTGILFLIAALFSGNLTLLVFSVALLVDVSKLFNISALPQSRLTMIFAVLMIADTFFHKLRNASALARTLRWSKHEIIERTDTDTPAEMLKKVADHFQIEQISILSLQVSGQCQILIQRGRNKLWTSETLFREHVPAIFAHVLSTREPLWHVETGSLLASDLRKGELGAFIPDHSHFTVIPLIKDANVVGALGITGYSIKYQKEPDKRLEFESAMTLVAPVLSNLTTGEFLQETEDWQRKCSHVAEQIHSMNGSEDLNLDRIAELVFEGLGMKCFLMQVDRATRELRLQGISGFSEEAREVYRNSKFYAVSHNEQGPAPLAVNKKKSVFVPDINWIRGVLHSTTLKVFELANTRSCAAIPIFQKSQTNVEQHSERDSVWGLLWIESEDLGRCSPKLERGIRLVVAAIEAHFSNAMLIDASQRSRRVLEGFVPAGLIAKVLAGESVRENDIGLLLMADLKDSTRISRLIGAEKWISFTRQIILPASALARQYGFTLQSLVWDAFYFTRSTEIPGTRIEDCLELAQKLNILFSICFKRFLNIERINQASPARYCVTFGDITRDIQSSLTDHWTIVGSAMASVSKLEQACKSLDGWFFASSITLGDRESADWLITEIVVSSTDERIVKFVGTNSKQDLSAEILNQIPNDVHTQERAA